MTNVPCLIKLTVHFIRIDAVYSNGSLTSKDRVSVGRFHHIDVYTCSERPHQTGTKLFLLYSIASLCHVIAI
jgi:hypothetical protein